MLSEFLRTRLKKYSSGEKMSKMDETNFIIPAALLRSLFSYLKTKPWVEVEAFMTQLQALQVVVREEREDEKEDS